MARYRYLLKSAPGLSLARPVNAPRYATWRASSIASASARSRKASARICSSWRSEQALEGEAIALPGHLHQVDIGRCGNGRHGASILRAGPPPNSGSEDLDPPHAFWPDQTTPGSCVPGQNQWGYGVSWTPGSSTAGWTTGSMTSTGVASPAGPDEQAREDAGAEGDEQRQGQGQAGAERDRDRAALGQLLVATSCTSTR